MQALSLRHDTLIEIATFLVRRWSGDENTPPQIDRFEIDVKKAGTMVLDILNQIKAELDPQFQSPLLFH